MINPFRKRHHEALIAGIAIGAVAAGTAAFLFLTDRGADIRVRIAENIDRFRDSLNKSRGDEHEAGQHNNYMQHHHDMKPKSDRRSLLHHQ